MTTRKNSSPKPVKKAAAKPPARVTAKKGIVAPAPAKSTTAKSADPKSADPKSSASKNGAAPVTAPEPAPVVESVLPPPVAPTQQPPAPAWRVFSQTVGPNLYGGDLDFVVDLRGDNPGTAPQFVSVSAEGIAPEFGDAFAFRIIERTADFVRVRVHRLDVNGGSWGDNLVVQVLCVY
jgi:hypothetical protein